MSGYDYSQDVANELLEACDKENDKLQAENAALKAELKSAEERQGFCFACGNLITDPCDVTKLKAELAAAQKDAERYRWLRSPDRGMANLSTVINDDCQPPYYELKCGTELDAAIDKELAK